MNRERQPNITGIPERYDLSCLAQLLSAAGIVKGGVDGNPGMAMLIEDYVFLEDGSGDRELLCHQCPVTGTLKQTSEGSWPVVHNRADCAEES